MTVEELVNRFDDLVAALERIATVLENIQDRERGTLRIETRER